MTIIGKNQVTNLLLLQYLHERRFYQEKMESLSIKHGSTFEEFELKLTGLITSSFEDSEDYIDWKAYQHFLKEADQKITDIRNVAELCRITFVSGNLGHQINP